MAWVLWWIQHALIGHQAIYDAAIFVPAGDQLTGSEHFLSSQLLFLPAFLITHNVLLSTNVVALLSYPLAALAMDRLLVRLNVWPASAWLAGLIFSLGPLRVPGSLQVLQYLNFYLPLSVLGLDALRGRAGTATWILCTVGLLAGLFSSYYMAVLVLIVALLWIGIDSIVNHGTFRSAIAATSAVGAAVASLAVFSLPYFTRKHGFDIEVALASVPAQRSTPASPATFAQIVLADRLLLRAWFGSEYVPAFLAALGIPAAVLGVRCRSLRAISLLGIGSVAIGLGLSMGALQVFDGHLDALIGFFRYKVRFLVLIGFGQAILAAIFLDLLHAKRPRLSYMALALSGCLLVLIDAPLIVPSLDEPLALSRDRARYEMVRDIAKANGGGALLELPWRDSRGNETSPDAMVGATIHELPLVNGYTGYFPSHWALLRTTLSRLPGRAAIDDLMAMTGVRWLLLRPAEEWPESGERAQLESALATMSPPPQRWNLGDWVLFHLPDGQIRRDWFAALHAGIQRDRTVLGTPLVPLSPSDAVGTVQPRSLSTMKTGSLVRLPVDVTNNGSDAWPVAVPGGGLAPGVVYLAGEWLEMGADGHVEHRESCTLPRDIDPGETVTADCWLTAPAAPGTYALEVQLAQVATPAFGGKPARIPVAVSD